MTFPQDLTERLLEFVLDNHAHVAVCATGAKDEARCATRELLRTGIEFILLDTIEKTRMKQPTTLPVEQAVDEATESIWSNVLGTFDDNVWLDKEERIVFFARWETDLKKAVKNLLTRLVEDT